MAPKNALKELEQAARAEGNTCYVLRLYVAGMTPKSSRAIRNIPSFCEEQLKGRYELEIVDIYQRRMGNPAVMFDEIPGFPRGHGDADLRR